MRFSAPLIAVCLLSSCRFGPPKFDSVTEEFVFTTLSFSPVTATAAGYHRHAGVPLDELIDDISEASFNRQRDFYRSFERGLAKFDRAKLTPEDRADYDLIQNQIRLALLDLDVIQRYKHDPSFYVELVGQSLYAPYVLEYASKELRMFHIIRRLEVVPALINHARRNLLDSPEVTINVAREENEGNISLIDKTLRAEAPPDLKPKFDQAASAAIDALRGFNAYLMSDLAKRPSDWRLGKDKYAQKFRYALATDKTPEALLSDAESVLQAIRQEMDRLTKGKIKQELDRIAGRHATLQTYFTSAQRDLDEATNFVRAKVLVPLPAVPNLKVVETPPFMRGSYPVGGFNAAPALEPKLQAQYWLTPIPADWARERIDSKLREYNTYSLKLLTIHEAMPGHYVQFEYANTIEPRSRRLLRTLYGAGTYVEGWAEYAMQLMVEENFVGGDPDFRLMFLKWKLRAVANAILDIRMHTMAMTDHEALRLMIGQTFQEREEAEAKLTRVKITSTQLPTYFVGWRDWLRLREGYRAAKGRAFSMPEFHERALKAGALPVPLLAELITGNPLPAVAPPVPLAP